MSQPARFLEVLLVLLLAVAPVPAQEPEVPDIQQLLEALANEELLQDPAQIMTWVTLPRSAAKGDEVTLEVTIENGRDGEAFRLSSIDLQKRFISGFTILELSPKPRNRNDSLGDLSLEYPIDIPAGESRTFRIRLRAQEAGVYIGDVDVYEGAQFLTRKAQIRVR